MVGGLSDDDARALLRLGDHRAAWTSSVRDRIVAETRGNPLALLELPRGLTPAELAGGFGLPDARPLASRIEQSFLRRLEALPAETRRLLLVAAAEPVGDVDAAVARGRAARDRRRRGGAGRGGGPDRARRPGAVPPSARALGGLPRGDRRSDRQAVHRALAEATDPELDPDRRAWHRAHARRGPDEEVAGELERSADRAQAAAASPPPRRSWSARPS